MADLLLGVDAGQTVTKAVLFDVEGTVRASGSTRVPVHTPAPRWVERDMEEVWQATASAIRACLHTAGVPATRVAAVGVVGHNDGLYPVDAAGSPVRAAVTAMDSRAHEVLAGWRQGPVWPQALRLTGQVPFAASPAAVLAWFAQYEPSVLDRSRWFLFCKDWLKLRLTGEVSTDPSEASASFTDVHTQGYAPAALELYGLAGYADRLPPILPSTAVAGGVTGAAAADTGLALGTPVVSGAHDVDAAALGMGAVDVGALSLVAGTFSINQVVSADVRVDERWQARSFVEPRRWLNMSTSPASATNLEWFLRTHGGAGDYLRVEQEVAESLTGPSSVLYLPFLYGSPHGEQASGAFVGLRGWHGRGHVLRALLEGVVLNHRTHVTALRSRFTVAPQVALSGGASRSALWSQLFADALRLPVVVPRCVETGAHGAALLAGIGAGLYPDVASAARVVQVSRRHVPDPARADVLDAAYAAYLDAVEGLAPVWAGLAR